MNDDLNHIWLKLDEFLKNKKDKSFDLDHLKIDIYIAKLFNKKKDY